MGFELSYVVQPKPGGIAEAFLLGANTLGNLIPLLSSEIISFTAGSARDNSQCCELIDWRNHLRHSRCKSTRLCVVEFGADGAVLGIEENRAVPSPISL